MATKRNGPTKHEIKQAGIAERRQKRIEGIRETLNLPRRTPEELKKLEDDASLWVAQWAARRQLRQIKAPGPKLPPSAGELAAREMQTLARSTFQMLKAGDMAGAEHAFLLAASPRNGWLDDPVDNYADLSELLRWSARLVRLSYPALKVHIPLQHVASDLHRAEYDPNFFQIVRRASRTVAGLEPFAASATAFAIIRVAAISLDSGGPDLWRYCPPSLRWEMSKRRRRTKPVDAYPCFRERRASLRGLG